MKSGKSYPARTPGGSPLLQGTLGLLLVGLLSSCGSGSKKAASSDASGSAEMILAAKTFKHPAAEAYYASNSDFFRSADPTEIPADLQWVDGMDQESFSSTNAKRGGTETVWIQDFPRTLRYLGPDANGSFRRYINDNLNLKVVHKHPETGRYYPGLAREWAIAPNNLTVYLKLDPEARYTDGVAVTADDYYFLFYFMRSPWLQGPWYLNWYTSKYTHITRYDDHTIAIGLSEAKPDCLRFFEQDIRPVPRHFYKDFRESYVQDYQWKLEPGTGAYTILEKDIKKGRSLTQTRIEDWWADDKKFWKNRFNPDKRRFVVVRDLNKMLESFKRGDFDMLRIRTPENWGPKLDIPEVKNGYIHRAQFYNQVPRPTYAMRINQTKPLLDNRDIRIGIHHASNWDLILKEIFKGDYTRMRTTSDGYGEFTHPTLQARPFSVEEATASFANAGFDQRGPDGILVNADGKKLSFTLTTGYKRLEDALSILVEEAKKAGLELKLEVLDSTAGWKKAQEKKHELMFTALNTAVEMYPRFFDFYHSYNAFDEMGKVKANTNNMTVTANPELDKMIEAYEKSQDLEEIKRLSHQIQEQVHEAGAYVPGFVRPFFRCAYWNWVQWPEGFSTRLSREHDEYDVHWIDEDLKTETMKARKESRALPQAPVIYDQHKNS